MLEIHAIEMILRSPFGSLSQFQLQAQEKKHADQTKLSYVVDSRSHICYSILRREAMNIFLQRHRSRLITNSQSRFRLNTRITIDSVLETLK